MGFLDKVGSALTQLKEENKFLVKTTARINNKNTFYGRVNYDIKNGDFREKSYVSIEYGKGVIYSTGTEDYFFTAADIAAFEFVGTGRPTKQGDATLSTARYAVSFVDGKAAMMDIIAIKMDDFKANFNL